MDDELQRAVEVKRTGNRVTVTVNEDQMMFLESDAKFYAEDNADGSPASIVRGDRHDVALCDGMRLQHYRE